MAKHAIDVKALRRRFVNANMPGTERLVVRLSKEKGHTTVYSAIGGIRIGRPGPNAPSMLEWLADPQNLSGYTLEHLAYFDTMAGILADADKQIRSLRYRLRRAPHQLTLKVLEMLNIRPSEEVYSGGKGWWKFWRPSKFRFDEDFKREIGASLAKK